MAYLIGHDSVYGRYPYEVTFKDNMLKIGEKYLYVFQKKDPAQLPWQELKVDIVLECTGFFLTEETYRHKRSCRYVSSF